MNLLELPHGLRESVETEVGRDERVLWCGRPRLGGMARRGLKNVLWGAVGIAVLWYLFRDGLAESMLPDMIRSTEWMLPALAILILLSVIRMFGDPLWWVWKGLGTVYVVTDKRAVVFDRGWRTTIRSYTPEKVRIARKKERFGGVTDIVFERIKVGRDSDGKGIMRDAGFLAIEDHTEAQQALDYVVARAASEQEDPDESSA